mmetsp:Transcript_13972/g.16233  ORF Transcript_13972/g.16233 Transcript_13972/m.16233 type:complete len:245 (-) Transcript_13972:1501-2235(-)
MAAFLGFSYVILVLGPALAFFLAVVSRKPELKLIAISSAFFWLMSIIIPSMLYSFDGFGDVIPLVILVSVAFEEGIRYWFTRVYMWTEKSIIEKTGQEKSPYSDWTSALSAGVGIGIMYTLIIHGGVISAAFDEIPSGDFFSDSCPELSLYWTSALNALLFQILHLSLSVLCFDTVRRSGAADAPKIPIGNCNFLVILMLHLVASFSTTINTVSCVGGLAALGGTVAISLLLARSVINQPDYLT